MPLFFLKLPPPARPGTTCILTKNSHISFPYIPRRPTFFFFALPELSSSARPSGHSGAKLRHDIQSSLTFDSPLAMQEEEGHKASTTTSAMVTDPPLEGLPVDGGGLGATDPPPADGLGVGAFGGKVAVTLGSLGQTSLSKSGGCGGSAGKPAFGPTIFSEFCDRPRQSPLNTWKSSQHMPRLNAAYFATSTRWNSFPAV